MSTVTITISVQPGADVGATGATASGSDATVAAATPPAPLEELGSPTDRSTNGAGSPPEDLEGLGDPAADPASAGEPLPLEELAADDQGLSQVAPGPMPLEELEGPEEASSKKGGKKSDD
jgi:hypothetical protein